MDDQEFLDEMRSHLRRAECDPATMQRSVRGMQLTLQRYAEARRADYTSPQRTDDAREPEPIAA